MKSSCRLMKDVLERAIKKGSVRKSLKNQSVKRKYFNTRNNFLYNICEEYPAQHL